MMPSLPASELRSTASSLADKHRDHIAQGPFDEGRVDATFNLTKDTAPALMHFQDGTTQQRLLLRMEEPKTDKAAQ